MPTVQKTTNKPRKPQTGISIVDGIVPISEMVAEGDKILITGDTNSGKTTVACSWPKPLLLIRPVDLESGWRRVSKVPGVEVTPPVTEPAHLGQLVEHVRQAKKYKTVVLDGVHLLQDIYLAMVLGLKEAPVQLSWGIATQQDWGTVGIELKTALRDFYSLSKTGIDTIVTGGERSINEGTDSKIKEPALVVAVTPSVAGWINFLSDYIVNTFVQRKMKKIVHEVNGEKIELEEPTDEVQYCLRTSPMPPFTVKFHVPKGIKRPPYIVDPSYDRIKKLLEGKPL